VLELLKESSATEIILFGGGIIPKDDIAVLKQQGVREIFTPGSSLASIVAWIQENVSN
jgi:methylmalonyl-CoA mutase C-terminal domain/subunit